MFYKQGRFLKNGKRRNSLSSHQLHTTPHATLLMFLSDRLVIDQRHNCVINERNPKIISVPHIASARRHVSQEKIGISVGKAMLIGTDTGLVSRSHDIPEAQQDVFIHLMMWHQVRFPRQFRKKNQDSHPEPQAGAHCPLRFQRAHH